MKTFNVIVALFKPKGIVEENIQVEAKNAHQAKRKVWGVEPIDIHQKSKKGTILHTKRMWYPTWPHFPKSNTFKRIVGVIPA